MSFVGDLRVLHLGHVMRNEPSRPLEITGRVGRDRLPGVCLQNAEDGSEPVGKIDVLFPDHRGRVMRPSLAWADAATSTTAGCSSCAT